MNKRDGNIGRPPNKVCKLCKRKSVRPKRAERHGAWRYPIKPICFYCLMIQEKIYSEIKGKKIPRKMDDNAKLLFPLIVYNTTKNEMVGRYNSKEDVLSAVAKYQNQDELQSRILIIHYPTFYDYTDYFISTKP